MRVCFPAFIALFFFGATFPAPCFAMEPPQYLLSEDQEFVSIKTALFKEDSTRNLSLNSLLEQEKRNPTFWSFPRGTNFGFSKSRYWIKFRIQRGESAPIDWIMEQRYSIIQQIHVFIIRDGIVLKQYRSGRIYPFTDRGIQHRNPLFPIILSDTSPVDCYVVLESKGTVQGSLRLYTKDRMISHVSSENTYFGAYYALLVPVFMFSFIVFLLGKDFSYLLYSLYIFSSFLSQASLSGFAYQFCWPSFEKWNNVAAPFFIGLCYLFLIQFTRTFLKTTGIINVIMIAATVCSGLLMAWSLLFFDYFINLFCVYFIAANSVLLVFVAVHSLTKKFEHASYFLTAFSVYLVAFAIYALKDYGLIPIHPLSVYALQIGSTFEIIILTIALGKKVTLGVAQKEFAELASDAAHDLASPITAMQTAAVLSAESDEDIRKLNRRSIEKVKSIVSQLNEGKRALKMKQSSNREIDQILVSAFLKRELQEKKFELAGQNVELNYVEDQGEGVFVEFNIWILSRIISNLINNANESIQNQSEKRISISASANPDWVKIQIFDNGPGMSQKAIAAFEMGKSFSTKGPGRGKGLIHAKREIERVGGKISIHRGDRGGTEIMISLRRIKNPAWYLGEILVSPTGHVVVLDDDFAIHEAWRNRFKSIGIDPNQRVTCITKGSDLSQVVSRVQSISCFLVDHELERGITKGQKSGEQWTTDLQINDRSVVVTSHWDNRELLQYCSKNGLKLIPKEMVSTIPIRVDIGTDQVIHFVLIDDSDYVHLSWAKISEKLNIHGLFFYSLEDFLRDRHKIPKDTPIYLDFHLKDQNATEIGPRLQEIGFTNLTLMTAEDQSIIPEVPWSKAVRYSKNPPWTDDLDHNTPSNYSVV